MTVKIVEDPSIFLKYVYYAIMFVMHHFKTDLRYQTALSSPNVVKRERENEMIIRTTEFLRD